MHPLRPGLLAHASGALWIEADRALVVADVHLGYGWAQRRRGELGPVAEDRSAAKLFATVDELRARTVVFAGDVVHAPKPGTAERGGVERCLRDLADHAGIVVVRGNHDRAFARDFASLGFDARNEWQSGDLIIMHGDRAPANLPESGTLVLGHVHPAGVIVDAAGVRHKVPVFLVSERLILLPAFSPYAAGLDIGPGLPPSIERLATGPRFAIAATGRTAAAMPVPETPEAAIRRTIRNIPRGKVATYGQVAEAAGYPGYHRQVCQVLNRSGDSVPWHRVLGSGGEIKLPGEAGHDQRVRLTFEGVRFRGKRVDMAAHGHVFSGTREGT